MDLAGIDREVTCLRLDNTAPTQRFLGALLCDSNTELVMGTAPEAKAESAEAAKTPFISAADVELAICHCGYHKRV